MVNATVHPHKESETVPTHWTLRHVYGCFSVSLIFRQGFKPCGLAPCPLELILIYSSLILILRRNRNKHGIEAHLAQRRQILAPTEETDPGD